jgi:hypothetical protein
MATFSTPSPPAANLWHADDQHVGCVSMHVLRRSWSCPQVKMSVGERIARWTLARQYGLERELQWKPAILLGMECQDGALVPRLDAEVRDPEGGTQPPASEPHARGAAAGRPAAAHRRGEGDAGEVRRRGGRGGGQAGDRADRHPRK